MVSVAQTDSVKVLESEGWRIVMPLVEPPLGSYVVMERTNQDGATHRITVMANGDKADVVAADVGSDGRIATQPKPPNKGEQRD